MMNFPFQPRITEKSEEALSTKLERPPHFLTKPDSSYLIVEGNAVRPGETHKGVSLSADSKTVTLEGVNITYALDDFWATPPVLMDLIEEDVTIQVNGLNSITSEHTGAMHIVRNHDQEMDKTETLMMGDSLSLTSDEFNALWIGVGLENPSADSNLTIRGMTLALIAQKSIERQYARSALCIDKGDLRIEDNSEVSAFSDYISTIEVSSQNDPDYQSALEIVNSRLSIVNNSTIRQATDMTNEIILSALYMGGNKAMLLDNSQLYIQLYTRTAEQVLGYSAFNAEEPTKIINGSTVSVTLKNPQDVDDATNGLLVGMASTGFDVQNSTVNIDLEGSTGDETAVWGFAYGKMPFNVKESDVTVNVKGPIASGIKYNYDHEGGDTSSGERGGPFLGDAGTVNITDANVDINTVSVNTKPTQNRHFALSGRFLNTSFSDTKYGLRVNVTSTLNDNFALGFAKYLRPEKVDYTPGYQAERINLGANSKILSPAQGEINMFSYAENDASNYLQNEVIFGADKTTPATSVTIGGIANPPSPSPSPSGGSEKKSPLLSKFDAPQKDVVKGKVDSAVLAQEALAAVKAGKTSLQIRNAIEITPEAFQKVYAASKTMPIYADTIVNGAVSVRLKLTSEMGRALTQNIKLGGTLTATETKTRFEKHFTNELAVVSLNQNDTFAMPVGIAARVDLSKLNAKTLYFYAYNRETNQYKQVKTENFVDANGYLHFTTTLAGDIIITDSPLTRRA